MNNEKISAKLPFSKRIKKRLELVKERKKIVVGLLLVGLFLGFGGSQFLPKLYKSSSIVFFKYNSVNSSHLANNGSIENEINVVTDNNFLEAVVNKLSSKGIKTNTQELLENTNFLADNKQTALAISAVADEADKSAEIANEITKKFVLKSLLKSKSIFIFAVRTISEREKSLKDDIRKNIVSNAETQLLTFSIPQQQLISQIANLEAELENIELDNQIYSYGLNHLKDTFEKKYPELSATLFPLPDPQIVDLITKLDRMETQKLVSGFSSGISQAAIEFPWEENYDLKRYEAVKKDLSDKLLKLITEVSEIRKIEDVDFLNELLFNLIIQQVKVNSVDYTKTIIFSTLTSLEKQFNQIPFDVIDVARQLRSNSFYNSLQLKIKSKLNRLKETERNYLADVESLKEAIVPETYFSPNTTLNTIVGGLIGLLIGFLIAITSSSNKVELVESAEDLEDTDLKLVAQIPSFPHGTGPLFDTSSSTAQQKLPLSITNAFANIETFLKYGSLDKAFRTVIVTSSDDGEGKSVIASNMAINLANGGNKVLLVDLDLKKPNLHSIFRIKSTPSLAHYLFRKKELSDIIRTTHNKNLSLITCIEFPQNPAVIITSERMKNFIDHVKNEFDYVVYDTSSLFSLKETVEIAKDIDEVFLVARANYTKLTDLISAETLLTNAGVQNVNVILNAIPI